MNHWLVKTEPDEYSYQMLQRQGRCAWTGVRNNLALKYLRLMKADDQVLVYHTGSEKAVVGLATVVREAYPDPTDASAKAVAVDLQAAALLAHPVSLQQIKAAPIFTTWELVRIPRLSVMPVSDLQFKRILELAK